MIGAAVAIAALQAAAPAAPPPVYVVFFEVAGSGAATTAVVREVRDPRLGRDAPPVPLAVPASFVDAARRRFAAQADRSPERRFIYLFLDPENPADPDVDPRRPGIPKGTPLAPLKPGESLVLHREGDGWRVASRGPADAVPMDRVATIVSRGLVDGSMAQPGTIPPRKAGEPPDRIPAPPDAVRFTARAPAAGHTLLVVENGFGRPLAYRATLTRPGAAEERTSVCGVAAGRAAFEHWAYDVAGLSIHLPELTDDAAKLACH